MAGSFRRLRVFAPALVLAAAVATAAAAPDPQVAKILDGLDDVSPIHRFESIDSLGKLGTEEAILALIQLTADSENAWLAVRQLVNLRGTAVPYLLEALRSGDPRIVRYAIYALGELRVREALDLILSYLTHPDPEVRQNAVFALGSIRDPRAVEPLIAKLRDSDNVVREYAAAALENIGDRRAVPYIKDALKTEKGSVFGMATALYNLGSEDVVDILLAKLQDPRVTDRLYVVYALGKIRDLREVEPLIDCLGDPDVQWLATKALINLGEMAVPSLKRAVKRQDREVRLQAIYALGEIADKGTASFLAEFLVDNDPRVQEYTTDALVKLRDRAVIPRLFYLLERGDCTIQSQVLKVLGALGDPAATSQVMPLLWCDATQVRISAAFALGEIKDRAAVPELVKLLGDEAPGVSGTAAAALVKIGEPAVPPLLSALPVASGKRETGIIHVLGKLRTREAVDLLMRKLSSPEPMVRRAAAVALTEIGDPRAEEFFVMLLNDPDPHVRMYASIGLMEFGGRLSVRLLLNALRSEETRWLAVRILDRIGPRGVDELIAALNDRSLQYYASQTLIKLDGAVLPQLEEGLRSDEETIRNNIAIILGEVKDKRATTALLNALQDQTRLVQLAASSLISIGDPGAVEPLIQCLAHPNEQVRLYAAYALGHLRDERAEEPLMRVLSDRDSGVRGIAAYSLGLLGSRKAIPDLVETLLDPDESVRSSAAYALGRIGSPQALPFLKERNQKDPSHRVRSASLEAIEAINFRTAER